MTTPTPAAVQAPQPAPFDVTLDEEQVKLLRDTIVIGDDADDLAPIRLVTGDGHSGYGLYLAQAEYQEEGAVLLAAMPKPTVPAPEGGPAALAGLCSNCAADGRCMKRQALCAANGTAPAPSPAEGDAWAIVHNSMQARQMAIDGVRLALREAGHQSDGIVTDLPNLVRAALASHVQPKEMGEAALLPEFEAISDDLIDQACEAGSILRVDLMRAWEVIREANEFGSVGLKLPNGEFIYPLDYGIPSLLTNQVWAFHQAAMAAQAPAPAHDQAVTHGQVGDLWRELGLPELMSWQWERLHQRFIPAIVRSVATSAPAVKADDTARLDGLGALLQDGTLTIRTIHYLSASSRVQISYGGEDPIGDSFSLRDAIDAALASKPPVQGSEA
jgi:hypothetical protein